MQINLDEKEIYYTGDLNKQQFEVLLNWLKKYDTGWEDTNIEDIQILNGYDSLKYSNESWWWELNEEQTKNAKELFYTLENIQVDCRELSEEQIKEMAYVFNTNGYKTWNNIRALKKDTHTHLFLEIGIGNEVYLNYKKENKTTITYSKFMELFGDVKVSTDNLVKGTETIDEVTPISLFSSREKRLKKTLKHLLKKDIILTPKQYKKLWKK